MSLLPAELYGKISGHLQMKGGRFNGDLNISNAGYGFRTKTLSGINTRLKIENSLFKINDIQAKILDQPCLFSIASTDEKLKNIFLNVNAKKLHIKSGQKKSGKSGPVFLPVNIKNLI